MSSGWKVWHTLAIFALMAAVVLVDVLLPREAGLASGAHHDPTRARMWSLVVTLVLFTAFTAVVGHGLTGRWDGALIGPGNRMSLSRLQMILWTILIVSGLVAAVLANVATRAGSPFSISIPEELWWAMGVSTGSLVGSPLILSTKQGRTADAQQEATTKQTLAAKKGIAEADVTTDGHLVGFSDASHAGWSDLFRGEEIGTAAFLDVGKLQMFLFTIVLVAGYAVVLGQHFAGTNIAISDFPAIDKAFMALLSISHAAYLGKKWTPQSKTAQP